MPYELNQSWMIFSVRSLSVFANVFLEGGNGWRKASVFDSVFQEFLKRKWTRKEKIINVAYFRKHSKIRCILLIQNLRCMHTSFSKRSLSMPLRRVFQKWVSPPSVKGTWFFKMRFKTRNSNYRESQTRWLDTISYTVWPKLTIPQKILKTKNNSFIFS